MDLLNLLFVFILLLPIYCFCFFICYKFIKYERKIINSEEFQHIYNFVKFLNETLGKRLPAVIYKNAIELAVEKTFNGIEKSFSNFNFDNKQKSKQKRNLNFNSENKTINNLKKVIEFISEFAADY